MINPPLLNSLHNMKYISYMGLYWIYTHATMGKS